MKKALKIVAGTGIFVFALLLATITTPDTTPLTESEFYSEWKNLINQANIPQSSEDTLYAGWAKINFTPSEPGPMAGYGKRKGKPYEQVHDSVFVRTVYLKSGDITAAIVSADLLIIPPTVTKQLKELLQPTDIPFDNIYFGATHTHNSVGGWGTGVSSLFFSGPYNPQTEKNIANAILESIRAASQHLEPVSITYREGYNSSNIKNRLIGDKGTIDPEIRAFELSTPTGQKLTLASFAAHSTVLSSRTMQLSRDWPGVFVDSLEQEPANFGMYLAGAVGSMAPNSSGKTDLEEMKDQGTGVYHSLLKASYDSTITLPMLSSVTLPLPLGEANPRVTPGWALRNWVFTRAFGDAPTEIRALRIGNILMVGVPADFSGELMAPIDAYAKNKGLNLIVTSFNGGYIGYVTDDRWYNLDEYETVIMNWYGPHKGTYFQEVIKDLVNRMK